MGFLFLKKISDYINFTFKKKKISICCFFIQSQKIELLKCMGGLFIFGNERSVQNKTTHLNILISEWDF